MEEALKYRKRKPRSCVNCRIEIVDIENKFQKALPPVIMFLIKFWVIKELYCALAKTKHEKNIRTRG